MKRLSKQIFAILMVLFLVLSISPLQANAASKKNVTISKAKQGTVNAIMYKGAKPQKGTFTMKSKMIQSNVTLGSKKTKYDIYNVRLVLTQKKLSNNYAAMSVKEMNAISDAVRDFQLILVDSKGNVIKDAINLVGIKYGDSSPVQLISGKIGGKTYSLYNWRKKIVFEGQVSIPHKKDAYIGFAGLRSGQIKTATAKKFENNKIDYYTAGFGSTKKGYIVVKKLK